MALNKTRLLEEVSVALKDTKNETWDLNELNTYAQRVVREIERREPKMVKVPLAIIEYTKNIDISSLTNLLVVRGVDYLPDSYPRSKCNWHINDDDADILKLDISYVPAITEDTLTGTLTFTNGDATVSGSGAAFETELAEGEFIRVSTASKFYRIVNIVSDTELELEIEFEETTVEDTVSVSVMRDAASIAYIYYGGRYTLEDTTTDLPNHFDEVLVTGCIAQALQAESRNTINQINLGEGVALAYLRQVDRQMDEYYSILNHLGRIDDDVIANYSKD